MSFLSIAWQHFSEYPLVMLYNHDEKRGRSVERLQPWNTHPLVYGGKDSDSGYSGLAMSENGKFAVVTELYQDTLEMAPPAENLETFVLDYLTGDLDPDSYLRRTKKRRTHLMPCNLVLGDSKSLFYTCSVSSLEEELSPGLHHVSDYFMDSPSPKCLYMQHQLEKYPQNTEWDSHRDELFTLT